METEAGFAAMGPANQVVSPHFQSSSNFFYSDRPLRCLLKQRWSRDAREYTWPLLAQLGRRAALEMDHLSFTADQKQPELISRGRFGDSVDQIEFHPAYHRMMQIAVDSQLLRIKYEPDLRSRFARNRHAISFATSFIYGMAESGQLCPICMTDAGALLLDLYAPRNIADKILPHIYTLDASQLFTGAMYLTEKAGGSDVGAVLVSAERREPAPGRLFSLFGEKWFCSNANADFIFVLARTPPSRSGTSGLSLFLVETSDSREEPPQRCADSSSSAAVVPGLRRKVPRPREVLRHMQLVRLKEKLGVRSMASAEVIFDGMEATLIGLQSDGFRMMTDMLNMCRLYNSIAAVAASRRAIVEAFTFLSFRHTFGRRAINHALVREKFFELGSVYLGHFYMMWRTIELADSTGFGERRNGAARPPREKLPANLHFLIAMLKRATAEFAVYGVREAMELCGGIGYIETSSVIPKILRDVNVLPIWEGTGNIMVLDMLRALSNDTSSGANRSYSAACGTVWEEIETAVQNLRDLAKVAASVENEADAAAVSTRLFLPETAENRRSYVPPSRFLDDCAAVLQHFSAWLQSILRELIQPRGGANAPSASPTPFTEQQESAAKTILLGLTDVYQAALLVNELRRCPQNRPANIIPGTAQHQRLQPSSWGGPTRGLPGPNSQDPSKGCLCTQCTECRCLRQTLDGHCFTCCPRRWLLPSVHYYFTRKLEPLACHCKLQLPESLRRQLLVDAPPSLETVTNLIAWDIMVPAPIDCPVERSWSKL